MENSILGEKINGYDNYLINQQGQVYSLKSKRVLSASKTGTGYFSVDLSNKGQSARHAIHRLVAQAFIPNPNNYPVVDHIDRNKTNNDISNLRWITHSGNRRNSIRPKTTDYPVGVFFHHGKYKARMRFDGKNRYLGSYSTPEEAGEAYEKKYQEIMSVFNNEIKD
mgnify:CR=1 FL=1